MSNTIVALMGGNPEALFDGIRELQTKKIIMISDEKTNLSGISGDLEKFRIPYEIEKIPSITFEDIFETVGRIRRNIPGAIMNISTATELGKCIALSAAFVNGLKAFYIEDNEVKFLPVLKFSYYNLIQDRKLEILRILDKDPMCCGSLEELSRKTQMSLPLISYHVNGNSTSDGLASMSLVQTIKKDGRIQVQLTVLGKLLVRGCV